MSNGEIPNYDGSYLLMPLANASGLSIDKVTVLLYIRQTFILYNESRQMFHTV